MPRSLFDDMALLEPELYAQLQAAGYTGGNTLEDLMKPINAYLFQRNQSDIDGEAWWIRFKDQGIILNKRFQLVIVEKWIQHFGS